MRQEDLPVTHLGKWESPECQADATNGQQSSWQTPEPIPRRPLWEVKELHWSTSATH